MAKCKDCLHWDACSHLFRIVIGREPTTNGDGAEEKCPNFKDRIKYAEVVHGRWVYEPIEFACEKDIKCSICGSYAQCETNYCPNCGAKMDGGKENE